MAVNDIYECTISGHVRREYCQTQIHLKENDVVADLIPARQVAEAVKDIWVATIVPLLSETEVGIDCIYVRRVKPTPGVAWTRLVDYPGTLAGEPIPSNSGLVLSWITAVANQRSRGRNWIWGLPEPSQLGGVITDAALTAWNDWVVDLMDKWGPGGTDGMRLCVYSPTSLTGENVMDGIVRTNLGVMRSRRQRPGTA